MNLHVVACPELNAGDYERIQEYRRRFNSLYTIIEPHFTLVFSVPDMELAVFCDEIAKQAQGIEVINFCLRCATINKDAISCNYDAFLVPDEGNSRILRLHDRLYSSTLERHHRLDIPYVPHISIANSPDAVAIKRIVDEWNSQPFEIQGRISTLDIINYENRVVTTTGRVNLALR